MGFIGPLIKKCGCAWGIGHIPDKYLNVTKDANEYDPETGRTLYVRYEDPDTTTEMNGWVYCREHIEENLKELFEENK